MKYIWFVLVWMSKMMLPCCCMNPKLHEPHWSFPRTHMRLAVVVVFLRIYCFIGQQPITTFHFVSLNSAFWLMMHVITKMPLVNPSLTFIHPICSCLVPIDHPSFQIHISLVSTPKIMGFFALWPVECLVFYHDFYWIFGWLDFKWYEVSCHVCLFDTFCQSFCEMIMLHPFELKFFVVILHTFMFILV
jgi:hypothetical protein